MSIEVHWADDHIVFDIVSEQYFAYDEADLEYGVYSTRQEAREALEEYARRYLNDS